MSDPRFPFGPVDVQDVDSAASVELTITNGGMTYVRISEMSAALALTCTVPDDMPNGALLFVEAASDGTARTITPGTGFTSAALAGTISKTKVASFVYIDGSFVNTGLQTIN